MVILPDVAIDSPETGRWQDLRDDALIDHEFTESDPESLPGISDDPPPAEADPEVEFDYDLTARGRKARCVYCKYPNHYHGIVVRYPSGARRLVGRDCALTHHDHTFRAKLAEFDAGVERQTYLRRRRHLMQSAGAILTALHDLKQHPSIATHDAVMAEFRAMSDIAGGIIEVARRGERLRAHRSERDIQAEAERKARLGDRFDEERLKAKAAGRTWQLFRAVAVDIGPLAGIAFFVGSAKVSRRIADLTAAVSGLVRQVSAADLKSAQIRKLLIALGEQADALDAEFDRLEGIVAAFSCDNLQRIAQWANEKVNDVERQEASVAGRKAVYTRPFSADGATLRGPSTVFVQGVSLIPGERRMLSVALPHYYRPPKREVTRIIRDAISVDTAR